MENLRNHYVQKYLSYDIRGEDGDRDYPSLDGRWFDREFSDCNQYSLLSEFVKVRDSVKVIVEIGVARLSANVLYDHTSTTVLINNKKDETIYLGIDVDDKSFLEKEKPNVHTLQARSEDYEIIKKKFDELGIVKIDFLFIDGWHSVNQVIDELFYIDYVPSGGIVGYHDTNYHPGPSKILSAFNPHMFDVRKHCIAENDYGIGFVTRK